MPSYRIRDAAGNVTGPLTEVEVKRLAAAGDLGRKSEISQDEGPFRPVRPVTRSAVRPPWFKIDMAVRPTWGHVDRIRESLVNHLATIFVDRDYCTSLTIVVSELFEWAIKHGDWLRFEDALVKLQINSDSRAGTMVEVASPCTPDSVAAREALQAVAELGGGADVENAYQRRLVVAAREEEAGDDRVLGLLRIAYETRCQLNAVVDADNYLRLSAIVLPPGPSR